MTIRMLIDASHEEETRMAIVRGNRVEDFDYESLAKRPLKSNVYLAKVTRVEPSLQAAFVEYGGNRHGFLAFSEIHPDYYQIPVADREALIAKEAVANIEVLEDEADDKEPEADSEKDDTEDNDTEDNVEDNDSEEDGEDASDEISSIHDEDEDEEARLRLKMAKRLRHRYKIQEVIKKNQIILIQVVKEERGNKGAALTTYLSLPGRYCVLMPNTLHGGGVSRKIASVSDRKRLKSILADLNMPGGMACIIRTAGHSRTKAEIKRDYDYLNRMWSGIRDLTLKSIAPTLIYEEGNLIKRSIRDHYTREIDEIWVEGEKGYTTARNFMRLLMPSHAKKVQHYKDSVPLFHKYQVEGELDSLYNPTVQLKSGGYIVINPTEALVSIDVNSGRATKGHNIEETAHKTNLEAAEEVARQLRLRDMAGLLVIDFIDMEQRSNNRSVEKRMKDCLKADRARLQVGRISGFGLMEMSRQRLRSGVLESSTRTCPHCEGTGVIRAVESQALHILRSLEEEGIRKQNRPIQVSLPTTVAIYMLNTKRRKMLELEENYGLSIDVTIDDTLPETAFRIDKKDTSKKEIGKQTRPEKSNRSDKSGQNRQQNQNRPQNNNNSSNNSSNNNNNNNDQAAATDEDGQPKRRRRRRRRGRGRDDNNQPQQEAGEQTNKPEPVSTENIAPAAEDNQAVEAKAAEDKPASESKSSSEAKPSSEEAKPASEEGQAEKKPRRRRRPRRPRTEGSSQNNSTSEAAAAEPTAAAEPVVEAEKPQEAAPAKRRARPARKKPESSDKEKSVEKEVPEKTKEDKPKAAKKPAAAKKKEPAKKAEKSQTDSRVQVIDVGKPTDDDDGGSKKKGWWQRAIGN